MDIHKQVINRDNARTTSGKWGMLSIKCHSRRGHLADCPGDDIGSGPRSIRKKRLVAKPHGAIAGAGAIYESNGVFFEL